MIKLFFSFGSFLVQLGLIIQRAHEFEGDGRTFGRNVFETLTLQRQTAGTLTQVGLVDKGQGDMLTSFVLSLLCLRHTQRFWNDRLRLTCPG